MLKQRVVTAAILVAVLLPALFARPDWPFAVLTLAGFATAGWEWSRLNGAEGLALALGIILAGICSAALLAGWTEAAPAIAWWAATAVWVLGGIWILRAGVESWPRVPRGLRWFVGLALLATSWLALVNAKAIGVNFILSVFCLVWTADIAAYFGGRALGRRKLAPAISPGKSWEGVWCGMAGALLLAALWLMVEHGTGAASPSFYAIVRSQFGLAGVALSVVFLASMSIVGDLFESLVKRSAGAKDSSGLLPGHGGVLDRIDALLPVFPIALALASLR